MMRLGSGETCLSPPPPSNLSLTVPRRYFFFGPQCYMLGLYVYGLQLYGQLNTFVHYASCFVLFCNLE